MNNRYWSLEFNTEQTVDEIINKALAAEPLTRGSTSFGTLLKPLPTQPLIVISSDMNHFAKDRENQRRDQLALEQLAASDPSGLLNTCKEEKISICGQIPLPSFCSRCNTCNLRAIIKKLPTPHPLRRRVTFPAWLAMQE